MVGRLRSKEGDRLDSPSHRAAAKIKPVPFFTLKRIAKQVKPFILPSVTAVSRQEKDPYKVLISCILSLRTQDETTLKASRRLFTVAPDPVRMLQLSSERIAEIIYPVGFYRTKSRVIRDITARIRAEFGGRVPDSLEGLLSLKGVGRKTANLVLGLGYGRPAICVDTHVHRISNRLGWVRTKTPAHTEKALEEIIPRRYWIELNTVFVAFGRHVCRPIAPWCSRCTVRVSCKRAGVTKTR